MPAEAVAAVQAAFATPLAVVVDRSKLVLDPAGVCLRVHPDRRRESSRRRAQAPTSSWSSRFVVRRFAPGSSKLLHRFARPAVDATLTFRADQPVIKEDRVGRALGRGNVTRRVAAALAANSRLPVRLRSARGRAGGRPPRRSRT